VLTPFGNALIGQISSLLAQATQVEQVADALASGWATEVVLAMDGIACVETVFTHLDAFSLQYPQTRIRILETTLSGTDEALLNRSVDLAITPTIPVGFHGKLYGQATKIAVAAKHHPLAQQVGAISEAQLKQYRQIVVRDSGQKREKDSGWLGAEQRWTVTHFSTSIKAISAGLGFGFLPKEMISAELIAGNLVALNLAMMGQTLIPLYVVPSAQAAVGKAAQAVMQALLGAAISDNS
jgi:DNA-binding transcriptional LysR family regulator